MSRMWHSNFVIRHHFSQFPFDVKKIEINKSFPCVAKNATGQRRYCHAVVSSCAIKHFYFQKLAMLINHVRIYGSNVAEG